MPAFNSFSYTGYSKVKRKLGQNLHRLFIRCFYSKLYRIVAKSQLTLLTHVISDSQSFLSQLSNDTIPLLTHSLFISYKYQICQQKKKKRTQRESMKEAAKKQQEEEPHRKLVSFIGCAPTWAERETNNRWSHSYSEYFYIDRKISVSSSSELLSHSYTLYKTESSACCH